MLANCGSLGLDPAALSLSGYLEALAAHNAAQDTDKRPAEADESLARFVRAHTTH